MTGSIMLVGWLVGWLVIGGEEGGGRWSGEGVGREEGGGREGGMANRSQSRAREWGGASSRRAILIFENVSFARGQQCVRKRVCE